ncbi:DUF6891 domain-containing protein [Streptosporangium sp. DT93]|uniref:DUF6891 domain-containing protein n=1 Tax=Streptosporangium sp. DT93 TaxID=3393428 RepID=UPI003CF619CE
MLAITVLTEGGHRHVRPDAGELAGLVGRIGGRDDRFLVVQRIPDLPGVFVQVWHEDEDDYTLEHREGTPDRHFQALVDGPEPVVTAMTRWAAREDGWDSGHDWTRVNLDVPEPPPPLECDEDEREELEARVREAIAAGYDTRVQLAELAEEYLASEDRRPVSPAQARDLVDRLWLERVGEQASWEGETDPERIGRAFEALEAAGITARENFACCRNCGQAEIGGVSSPDARGYAYFHSQCTDAAAAGHGLTLLYGGFDGSPDTTASVGREVVAALEGVGLPVRWNGDPGQAITVVPLDWRKRLVG